MSGAHDLGPPSGGRYDEAGDATRRTHLANERTQLAWWRTGLGAIAVGIAVGRVVPELAGGTKWPSVVLGALYVAYGIVLIVVGTWRQRMVEDAVLDASFRRQDHRVLAALTGTGVVLGVLTIAAILAEA